MTYFENMVATPEQFKLDLVYNVREILMKAAEEQNVSMLNFQYSQDEKNNEDLWWRMSCEANERSRGLLDAYEVITNRKVYNYRTAIEEEIKWIDDTFELFHE